MRESRFFATAFAAALASLLGLGPSSAATLGTPQSYQAFVAGSALPAWLVRFRLRQRGYQDIASVASVADGFAVDARDRWGRRVRLLVDAQSGEVLPHPGYGLAHLRPAELAAHLEALGYRYLAPVSYRDGQYEVAVRDSAGSTRKIRVDGLTGAVWS